MGSYCSLHFDDIEVMDWKSTVPDAFVSIFQESDRKTLPPRRESDEEDPLERIVYTARREVILDRLSVMGFTEATARQHYEEWRTAEIKMHEEWVQEGYEWARPSSDAIKGLSYDKWRACVPAALRRFDAEGPAPQSPIELNMTRNGDWLFFEVNDMRTTIRAFLDACPSAKTVTLDISDLISGGWLDENEKLCVTRRKPDSLLRPVLEPTVIMAEGTSDIRVLRLSLNALYPYLADYFTFFDHEELSVDGGASYLVKFLKALAAARMPTRLIALFDNDTTGLQAFRQARKLKMPSNITVLHLPDIELARNYPTIGPQGAHKVDVNGRAGGIELYLGRKNLTDEDNKLMPVRWTGYVEAENKYQGALEDKAKVLRSFERDITSVTKQPSEASYPELVAIWKLILASLGNAQ